MSKVSQDHAPHIGSVTSGQSHTPAPWVASVSEEGDNLSVVGPDDATVVGGCGCCGSPFMGKRAKADARLISAAPDLLEALRDLILYHDVPDHAQDPVVVPLLKAGFAAIAKAEGRS